MLQYYSCICVICNHFSFLTTHSYYPYGSARAIWIIFLKQVTIY
nr:MAG TPA_asm: hypothetical protein [Caudoviricetes sp.]